MNVIWPDGPVRSMGSTAPHFAAQETARLARGGRTLSDERHAIESRHRGWHVWMSDAGKPWAVRRPDATGQEATVTASHIGLMDHEIAVFERGQQSGGGAA
jgi:hypothetical protein